jgi:hypothetical protein
VLTKRRKGTYILDVNYGRAGKKVMLFRKMNTVTKRKGWASAAVPHRNDNKNERRNEA